MRPDGNPEPRARATPGSLVGDWWMKPVEKPLHDAVLAGSMTRTILRELPGLGGSSRRAVAHTLNAVARLAKNRTSEGYVQVTASYVQRGAGVSRATANAAISLVAKTLICSRTRGGYLTTRPEAIAACIDACEQIEIPRPLVHRDDAPAPEGPGYRLHTPSSRGVTRCPCGEHSHNDRSPSLAYDLSRGLATCQRTGTVLAQGASGEWQIVRRGRGETRAGSSPSNQGVSEMIPNAYPRGAPDRPWAPGATDEGGYHSCRLLPPSRAGGHRSLRRCYSELDLPDLLRWADQRYTTERCRERALICATLGAHQPDRFASLECLVLDANETGWAQRQDGSWYPRHPVYRSGGARYILIDLDDLERASTSPDGREREIERIRRTVRERSGKLLRCAAIVATSEHGLQVVVELPGWAMDTTLLYRSLTVRRALEAVSAALIRTLRRGGEVDRSAWAPGRMMRRPGWRTRDGEVVCARLWWARKPKPTTRTGG